MNAYEIARAEATRVVEAAYHKAVAAGELPEGSIPPVAVETPKDSSNGDWASTFAMQCAKPLHMAPRKIAETIVENLDLADSCFDTVEIAGPGFMNFTLNQGWYEKAVKNVFEMGADYGRTQTPAPEKVMVEFVSANPTGPMHMGNARGGAIGDCLASALDFAGYEVCREFYINDAGNQIVKFGKSLEARYLQLYLGEDAVEFPEDGYQGEDIKVRAKEFADLHGDKYVNAPSEERTQALIDYALPANVEGLRRDLEKYRIKYDVWFSEKSLHESGAVMDVVKLLSDRGMTYEKDGAVWYKATEFGAEKDEVLVRANGIPTYFMPLKDSAGLIKQYAFVSVTNYSSVGVGETVQDALRDYSNVLSQSGSSSIGSATGELVSAEGNVLRISSHVEEGITVYSILLDSDQNRIFTASASLSAELPITAAGDRVRVALDPPLLLEVEAEAHAG